VKTVSSISTVDVVKVGRFEARLVVAADVKVRIRVSLKLFFI